MTCDESEKFIMFVAVHKVEFVKAANGSMIFVERLLNKAAWNQQFVVSKCQS